MCVFNTELKFFRTCKAPIIQLGRTGVYYQTLLVISNSVEDPRIRIKHTWKWNFHKKLLLTLVML